MAEIEFKSVAKSFGKVGVIAGLDLKVEPRAGRLLMFPPYWMYQHAGLPPVSGNKYILSTYLMF